MPKYTVKDKQTGKTITFDWKAEGAPTDEDMQQIFSSARKPVVASIKPTTAVASSTAVTPTPKEEESDGRMGIIETVRQLSPAVGGLPIPRVAFSPRKEQAEVLQNVIAYGLPLASAPMGGIPGVLVGAGLAGLGEIGGQVAHDIVTGEKTNSNELAVRGGLSAVAGAFGQGAGELATRAVGKTLAPFARRYDKPLEDLAKRYNVQLPASAVSESRAVPLLESISGKGVFGDRLTQMTRKAEERLVNEADNLIQQVGKGADPSETGITIAKGMKRYEEGFRKTKDELYSLAQLKKDELRFTPTNTVAVLDETIARLEDVAGKKPAILGKLKALKRDLSVSDPMVEQLKKQGFDDATIQKVISQQKGTAKIPEFKSTEDAIAFGKKSSAVQRDEMLQRRAQLQQEAASITDKKEKIKKLTQAQFLRESAESFVGEGVDAVTIMNTAKALKREIDFADKNPIAQGYEGELRRISASLEGDLDKAIATAKPELKEAIDKANAFYREGVNKLNSEYGRKINQFVQSGQTDKIAQSILNKNTSVEDVPKIFEVVGEDGKNALKADLLDRMIGSQRRNVNDSFTPTMLDRSMKNIGEDKLKAIFDPQELQTIKDLSKLAASLGKAQKVSEGSQTTFTARIAGIIGLSFVQPAVALRLFMGDAAFSKFIASPVGQQWLKQGFKVPKFVQAAVPAATRVASQRLSNAATEK